jgi:hypothetical protein
LPIERRCAAEREQLSRPLIVLALASLGIFAANAAATFEATLVPRRASEREAGPTFDLEAGGGRRTRIFDLEVEAGRCGSIFAPLIDAVKASAGFAGGHGVATFGRSDRALTLRLELGLKPRGEALRATGLFTATVGSCHERIPLDLVTASIRGGGRHPQA